MFLVSRIDAPARRLFLSQPLDLSAMPATLDCYVSFFLYDLKCIWVRSSYEISGPSCERWYGTVGRGNGCRSNTDVNHKVVDRKGKV
jgi:hypothetical protein